MCEDTQLSSDEDHIKWVTHYASRDGAELWKTVALQVKGDWGLFEKVIFSFYPGAEEDNHCKYLHADLDHIVAAQVEISMNLRTIPGEYICKFIVVASFLKGKGCISKGECEAKFLSGFHPTFKAQLVNRLTLAYLEHHPDDLWPNEQVTYLTLHLKIFMRATSSQMGFILVKICFLC